MKSFIKSFLILVAIGITNSARAKTVVAKVNGMVCGFCAQGIEKKFKKEAAVEKIDVKLEKKTVSLGLKPGKNIEDARIKELLTDAGYSVTSIVRD